MATIPQGTGVSRTSVTPSLSTHSTAYSSHWQAESLRSEVRYTQFTWKLPLIAVQSVEPVFRSTNIKSNPCHLHHGWSQPRRAGAAKINTLSYKETCFNNVLCIEFGDQQVQALCFAPSCIANLTAGSLPQTSTSVKGHVLWSMSRYSCMIVLCFAHPTCCELLSTRNVCMFSITYFDIYWHVLQNVNQQKARRYITGDNRNIVLRCLMTGECHHSCMFVTHSQHVCWTLVGPCGLSMRVHVPHIRRWWWHTYTTSNNTT